MLSTIALSVFFCLAGVSADPATPLSLALVKQQFANALITPAVVPVFNPVALLNATFPAVGPIGTGQAVSKDNAGAEPTISIVGTDASFAAGGAFNTTTKYTLMMIDGDYAGAANPDGVNAHYLQNDLSYSQATSDIISLQGTTDAVIKYAGPGPAENSGPHRYILLLFAQPTTFAAPATPAAGSSVTMIDFPAYIQAGNLGNPLAGNYFTVEVGTAATVTPSATSAVNAATLSVSSAAGSTTGTGTASVTRSATSATGTAANSGAMGLTSSGFAVGVVAVAFGAFFA